MKLPVFVYITFASSVLSMTIGLSRWKNIDSPMRYFTVYLVITVIQIFTEFVLGRLGHSTQFLTDIYMTGETVFLLLLYKYFLSSQYKKILFISFIPIIVFIYIFSTIIQNGLVQFNTLLAPAARIILIITSLISIHDGLTAMHDDKIGIHKKEMFWIAAGVLIYCSGSFMVLTLGNEILNRGIDYFTTMWYFNWSFLIIANLLFSRSYFTRINE